jgi:ADP-heptose:LPS heptosyltransferase
VNDAGAPQRIGVFRALQLGDLLCAAPALRALKAAWPDSELSLIGLPWAAALLGRIVSIDRFIAFPGHPGLPEIEPDRAAWPGFLRQVREQRFDLLLQLHGSGAIVNPLLQQFGARRVVGFADPPPGVAMAEDQLRWPREGHEVERLLRLVDQLGLPRRGSALEFQLHEGDRAAAARLLGDSVAPYACVHAGSQLPSRRWPVERFAAVADELAARGLRVVLTGSAGEAALLDTLQCRMQQPALNLAGRSELGTLGALIDGAQLLVCNDTGVSHLAAALRRPSIVISCGAEVARWAPLDRSLHRVLWQPLGCRPCAYRSCPYTTHHCAVAIGVDEVLAAVEEALPATYALAGM